MATLTPTDLSLIHETARKYFIDYPTNCRLPGMDRDMTELEKRAFAFLEASAQCMNRLGILEVGATDVLPCVVTHTNGQNFLDEEMSMVVPKFRS